MPTTFPQVEPPPGTPPTDRQPMVDVAIKRVPGSVGLTLTINARPLHDLLDSMGVPRDGASYMERPREDTSTVDRDRLLVSTHAILKRAYPLTIRLSEVFSAPVSHAQLVSIANSVRGQTERILDHYRPVDIRTRVYPSASKGG